MAHWGAQEGVQRVDPAPYVRTELLPGDMVARIWVDYRERVAGDLERRSGVAVRPSTRF
ncbi:hypothetical protein [Altererythrobacter sp.]|uniref:hypothetical protein n=1 Tax=Altererythrobacter sp. TaxID=1872480 RepID=UPI001B0C5AAF|nr:hypothetical protein [Altererythrobacter sp.]MBO6608755.1 hypothetical protein [Altererythrobacter sp.]MBO6640795.1 hypothetical protein [Altererythrobacter sp.]MBO6708507.1 hypothetical protein [Altererythrobacter sp.]MBO6945357.1 hypothetical protein [Altererythrobacter sp.]